MPRPPARTRRAPQDQPHTHPTAAGSARRDCASFGSSDPARPPPGAASPRHDRSDGPRLPPSAAPSAPQRPRVPTRQAPARRVGDHLPQTTPISHAPAHAHPCGNPWSPSQACDRDGPDIPASTPSRAPPRPAANPSGPAPGHGLTAICGLWRRVPTGHLLTVSNFLVTRFPCPVHAGADCEQGKSVSATHRHSGASP